MRYGVIAYSEPTENVIKMELFTKKLTAESR